jgi:hypothetical protein
LSNRRRRRNVNNKLSSSSSTTINSNYGSKKRVSLKRKHSATNRISSSSTSSSSNSDHDDDDDDNKSYTTEATSNNDDDEDFNKYILNDSIDQNSDILNYKDEHNNNEENMTFLSLSNANTSSICDEIFITDITSGMVTVTIKESLTPDGFFKNRESNNKWNVIYRRNNYYFKTQYSVSMILVCPLIYF